MDNINYNTAQLVKDGQITDNNYQIIDSVDDLAEGKTPIVKASAWLEDASAFASFASIGILLAPGDEPALIADSLDSFSVIAVDFPKFADGRGYSTARELRETYKFEGEIRSVGDVLLDQLYYMKQVGFNAFAVREDIPLERALESFKDYQADYLGPTFNHNPWFKRAQ